MTPPTPEPISAEELERMREEHQSSVEGFEALAWERACVKCAATWPCDAARLLSERDRYVAELDKCARLLVDANGEVLRVEAALDAEREKVKNVELACFHKDRTIGSLAKMLGWDNVPPQATLEMTLSALKHRLGAEKERAERAEAERDKFMAVVEAARFLVEVGYHTGGVGTNAIRAALAALDAGEAQHGTKDKP